MRQSTLLVGTAGLTLVVLVAGFLAFRALTGPETGSATPTPAASAGGVEPTPSASVEATPSVAEAATPAGASATPTPVPTPVGTPGPTPVPGETVTYTVKGSQYVDSQVPPGGAITNLSGGAITMTTAASSEELIVTYRLTIPAGRVVKSYEVKVCGSGSGNFWETYGPPGANPVEYEYEEPASDGCWHFAGGSMTNTTVLAIIGGFPGGTSQMQVDRIDYVLTFK